MTVVTPELQNEIVHITAVHLPHQLWAWKNGQHSFSSKEVGHAEEVSHQRTTAPNLLCLVHQANTLYLHHLLGLCTATMTADCIGIGYLWICSEQLENGMPKYMAAHYQSMPQIPRLQPARYPLCKDVG